MASILDALAELLGESAPAPPRTTTAQAVHNFVAVKKSHEQRPIDTASIGSLSTVLGGAPMPAGIITRAPGHFGAGGFAGVSALSPASGTPTPLATGGWTGGPPLFPKALPLLAPGQLEPLRSLKHNKRPRVDGSGRSGVSSSAKPPTLPAPSPPIFNKFGPFAMLMKVPASGAVAPAASATVAGRSPGWQGGAAPAASNGAPLWPAALSSGLSGEEEGGEGATAEAKRSARKHRKRSRANSAPSVPEAREAPVPAATPVAAPAEAPPAPASTRKRSVDGGAEGARKRTRPDATVPPAEEEEEEEAASSTQSRNRKKRREAKLAAATATGEDAVVPAADLTPVAATETGAPAPAAFAAKAAAPPAPAPVTEPALVAAQDGPAEAQPSSPGFAPTLPPGWLKVTSPKGDVFFLHLASGKSQYRRPLTADDTGAEPGGGRLNRKVQRKAARAARAAEAPLGVAQTPRASPPKLAGDAPSDA